MRRMNKRHVLTVLTLAGIGLALALWLALDAPARRRVTREGPASQPETQRARTPADPTDEQKEANTDNGPGAASETAGVPTELSGTVVVVDSGGAEYSRESGTLDLVLWRGAIGLRHDVAVEEGRWTTRIPGGVLLGVSSARLRNRIAAIDHGKAPVPESGFLALRARWVSPLVLRVTDEAGSDLREIEIVRRKHGSNVDARLVHPGAATAWRAVRSAVASPIEFPPSTTTATYWVRAPGYAWQRMQLYHRSGGEFRLRLQRAGRLEIAIPGPAARNGAVLRLRGAGVTTGPPVAVVAVDRRELLSLDHLPPNRYTVSAELGPWSAPRRLAFAETEVVAGATVRVSLVPESRRSAPPLPLAGSLVVPPTWGIAKPIVGLQAKGNRSRQIKASRLASTEWRWDAGQVVPGPHTVTIRLSPDASQWFEFRLNVNEGGDRSARLVIPEPADVILTTVDEVSGQPVVVQGLEWHVSVRSGVVSGSHWAVRRERDGLFRFRAPVGRLRILLNDPRYAVSRLTEPALRPGRNPRKLLLRPRPGIRITFRDGETIVPAETDVTVEALDGGPTRGFVVSDGTRMTVFVPGPGRYRLKIGKIAGYRTIAPQTVQVGDREKKDVVVALHRNP